MIFSQNLLLSDDQAITASAPSDNVIDLGATGTVYGAAAALSRDIGPGTEVPILVQVTEDFATLTSLTISIEVDDDEAFSSPTEVASQTIPVAALVAGKKFNVTALPDDVDERYLRINYTVAGTNATAGKVTAGIVAGVQTNG